MQHNWGRQICSKRGSTGFAKLLMATLNIAQIPSRLIVKFRGPREPPVTNPRQHGHNQRRHGVIECQIERVPNRCLGLERIPLPEHIAQVGQQAPDPQHDRDNQHHRVQGAQAIGGVAGTLSRIQHEAKARPQFHPEWALRQTQPWVIPPGDARHPRVVSVKRRL